tara:strand:- start:6898 stop:7344 length:447 start_codon:yes stop_codon:yes gene_type:complete
MGKRRSRNLGIAIYDSVDDVISMFQTQWNYDNDDSPKPRFTKVWEEKAVGIIDDLEDTVVITPGSENVRYFNLYGTNHLHTTVVIIDIRSYDEDRFRSIVNQVDKIIKNQIRRDNFIDLRLTQSKSLSQDYRNMFRHIFEVTYRKLDP